MVQLEFILRNEDSQPRASLDYSISQALSTAESFQHARADVVGCAALNSAFLTSSQVRGGCS